MSLRALCVGIYVLVVLPALGVILALCWGWTPLQRLLSEHGPIVASVCVVTLALSGWALIVLDRRLRRGAGEIERAARAYARGELRHRVPLHAQDELADAGRSLNEMAESLERSMDESRTEARFDLLRRCRSALARDVESAAYATGSIADLIDVRSPSPAVVRGAGHALRRLAARLRRVERALADPDVANDTRDGLAVLEAWPEEAVDLGGFVRGCVVASGVTDLPDVRVRVAAPADGPPLAISAEPLRRALDDVLLNARLAMPEGGLLKIEARPAGGRVTFTVIDSGIGMSRRFMERRLFRPFASGWTNGQGFGLALYRTRARLRALGGDVDVTSSPGVGTRVSFWLPVSTDVANGGGAGAGARSHPGADARTNGPARAALGSTSDG